MAGNKENMKQAMKELLGLVGIGPEADKEPAQEPEAGTETGHEEIVQEVTETVGKDFGTGEGQREERGGFFRRREEEPVRDYGGAPAFDALRDLEPPKPAQEGSSPNLTVISEGTSLFGDIRSEGDVEVRGKLKGNLEATGRVRVTGKVLGDVKGDSVVLIGCAIQGNITAAASVKMDKDTIVVGDIVAGDLVTDGKVKGSVQVERSAAFQSSAVLAGNVTASLVSMCEGAKVQGTVRISEDSETNALFGENLDI